MKINKQWLFNIYQNEAGAEGTPSTAGVETAASEPANTDSLLTGQSSEAPQTQEASGADESASTNDGAAEQTGEGSQTAPETYADFVLPEGVELDEALLSEATPVFKELNLTQEQAQKLVDLKAKEVEAGRQSQVDAFNQLMQDWTEQSRNDKEFGGDKFEENVKIAISAVDKFGTPELKQLLKEHGMGNHPEVIRFMVKVGKLTQEDVPGGTGQNVSPELNRVSAMYPNDRTA
jgi:polyhydroxyalkanoate synthesis regulator phasin